MSFSFPPDAKAIVVPVTVVGPRRSLEFRCTLDTGSKLTLLPVEPLRLLGFDLARPASWVRLRTAPGATRAPLVRVPAIAALGRVRTDLLVAAHDLPPGLDTDGLLGLVFCRGLLLKLDFARGRVTLSPPKWWLFWR